MEREEALGLLRIALNDPDAKFREGQWEAIDLLVNQRRKLLVVQRTGWGKSSVYFISTRVFRDIGSGPTIIISPLLALMRNQMVAAERLGIRAVTINSANTGSVLNANQHKQPSIISLLNTAIISDKKTPAL